MCTILESIPQSNIGWSKPRELAHSTCVSLLEYDIHRTPTKLNAYALELPGPVETLSTKTVTGRTLINTSRYNLLSIFVITLLTYMFVFFIAIVFTSAVMEANDMKRKNYKSE